MGAGSSLALQVLLEYFVGKKFLARDREIANSIKPIINKNLDESQQMSP